MSQPAPVDDPGAVLTTTTTTSTYPTLKPGWTTSEFWVTVFTTVLSAVLAIAALFGHNLDGSNLQPLIGLAGLIASGLAVSYYNHSRGVAKAAHQQAVAYHMASVLANAQPIAPYAQFSGPGGPTSATVIGGDDTGADGVGGTPTARAAT